MSEPSAFMLCSVWPGRYHHRLRVKPPRRSDVNRMRPLGSQQGSKSLYGPSVSCRKPEPSAFTAKMW
ncbi:MAG TPA: hypothetical protein VM223_28345 [Planctomycetota bacterium]|nr:hypothetical protein [Planctomycetota bacterium]